MNEKEWLQDGEQTKLTSFICEVAKKLNAQSKASCVLNILVYIRDTIKFYEGDVGWNEHFRNRTAEEILQSRMASGCGDIAVIFCALARACDIPCIYVEAPYKSWLANELTGSFRNHVLSKVFIDNAWHYVDPTKGNMGVRSYKDVGGGVDYVVIAEGLDSWNIGINSKESYKAKYLPFREEWRSSNKLDNSKL